MTTTTTYGPVEARVRWEADDVPYDWGDIDPTPDEREDVEIEGVWGCVVEVRRPACGCCGRADWEHGASLWGVTSPGDGCYYREVERDLLLEV
jgi:hypothetical protein